MREGSPLPRTTDRMIKLSNFETTNVLLGNKVGITIKLSHALEDYLIQHFYS